MSWKLFFTFVKIGLFTIGGGFAMIPLIEKEIVDKGWISKQDFIDLLAVTQSLPGVLAVNISIFVGYRLHKLKGGLMCALGTILPSFMIILVIAMFFHRFQENVWVMKMFQGIRPAIVALIVVPCINTARSLQLKMWQLIAPAIGALLIWKGGLSPAYLVLVAILGGFVYSFWIKKKISPTQSDDSTVDKNRRCENNRL